MLAGSMGMLPSASLGDVANSQGLPLGLYEPSTATPDIAGKASPTRWLPSSARPCFCATAWAIGRKAAAVEAAVDQVLEEGVRTPDIAYGHRSCGHAGDG